MTEDPVAAALETPEPVAPRTGRVVIVANPVSGSYRQAEVAALARELEAGGVCAEIRLTERPGHMVEIARDLAPAVDTLVVAGGDGSINEAVNGLLMRSPPPPALAVLPFGTANVLVRELGLPQRPGPIAAMLLRRRLAPLHLGRIGLRAFVLMVSAGLDGAVVHGVDLSAKRRFGRLAYATLAARLVLAGGQPPVTVRADGDVFEAAIAVVTTARCYGGPMTLTRHTDVTRPGLRLVALRGRSRLALLAAAVLLLLGRLDRLACVTDRAVARVQLLGDGVRMQLDGEAIAASDAAIEAHPRGLSIVVP